MTQSTTTTPSSTKATATEATKPVAPAFNAFLSFTKETQAMLCVAGVGIWVDSTDKMSDGMIQVLNLGGYHPKTTKAGRVGYDRSKTARPQSGAIHHLRTLWDLGAAYAKSSGEPNPVASWNLECLEIGGNRLTVSKVLLQKGIVRETVVCK